MKKYTGACVVLLLAVLCFVGLAIQIWTDRNKEVFLEISAENETSQDVSVWIEVTKSWQDKDKIGL